MNPALEYLPRNTGESFVTRLFDYEYFPTPWHFHPEYEIVQVLESTGKRFIGNNVTEFSPGDMVLIGPYLPHTYQNDAEYLKGLSSLRAKSIVIHFKEDSFGENFFNLPETQGVANLLTHSQKGLMISGETNQKISARLDEILNATGLRRWVLLVDILQVLADSKDLKEISNTLITGQNPAETKRMNNILKFVLDNFQREIHIFEIADLSNMAENSFSRYFSQRTRKSFTSYVNEVRLNYAANRLIETQDSITQVCFECGFSNLSNFNRQFKIIYKSSPLVFRKLFQNINN
jgi:AraC-like DNA-binding protein